MDLTLEVDMSVVGAPQVIPMFTEAWADTMSEARMTTSSPSDVTQQATKTPFELTHDNLLERIKHVKKRHARASHKLSALRNIFLAIPVTIRNAANIDPDHSIGCLEAFEGVSDLQETFTGAMLEAVSTVISDAETAMRSEDLAWAEVEVSGAEEFMFPTEDKVRRLQETVSVYTQAAKGIGKM